MVSCTRDTRTSHLDLQFDIVNRETTAWRHNQFTLPDTIDILGLDSEGNKQEQI